MRFSLFDAWWLSMAVLVGLLLRDLVRELWRKSFGAMSLRERMNRLLDGMWPQVEEQVQKSLRSVASSVDADWPRSLYSPAVVMTMAYSAHLRGELTDVLRREAVLAYVDGQDWPGLEDPQWLVVGAAAEEQEMEKRNAEERERGSFDGGSR